MSDRVENGYMEYVPTRREKLWRRLGWRYHLGEDPKEIDAFRGWMVSGVQMHFGWLDRLRMLATGRLHIKLTQHTREQCGECKNRVDWQIKAPGER